MINVDELYVTVRDLTRKDFSGWINTDEFNRILSLAQKDIFDFYLTQNQVNHRVFSVLQPFIAEDYVSIVSGYGNLPDDYKFKLEVGVEVIENGTNGCDPSITVIGANQINSDKHLLLTESVIKGPSISAKRFYYEFIASQIKIHPVAYNGRVYLKYYRHPAEAQRGYTTDTVTLEEVYNDATSTQLEWNSEELSTFVDMVLFYKGIILRESELISWIHAKRSVPIPTNIISANH